MVDTLLTWMFMSLLALGLIVLWGIIIYVLILIVIITARAVGKIREAGKE